MKYIAILASGEGTNAEHLINYFNGKAANVSLLACNNPRANAFSRAARLGVKSVLINKEWQVNGESLLNTLKDEKIDLIVCAGFLWKIPEAVLHAFPNKVVNIHPALLPKFGGKGMYGQHVHGAVIEAGEKESGITIHCVNEHYDEGAIILQKKCTVAKNETPESLAQKVQQLEHEWYPKTIEQLLNKLS